VVNRRAFLRSLGAASVAAHAQSRRKPNIILFLVDDMGRDWVSCYGAAHRTPNVDRFAGQGVRFETAWSTPICTPTRIELLTGKYPFQSGWTDHYDVPRWGGKGFDWDREITFARLLKEAGYATAITGKWQVNDFRTHPDALRRHGFDEHCMWTGFETGNPASAKRFWDAFLQINGQRKTHEGEYGPDIVNQFARDFIRRHKERPFLLYYPAILTHGPNEPTPDNKASAPSDQKGLFAGMVSYMDKLFGKLIDEVNKQGLAENTFVVFTSDNGTPPTTGSLNGVPCPPGKGRITNLGSHVPFIVRAPWLTASAKTSMDLVDFSDIFPTLAELAGASVPKRIQLDGRSFLGSITGTRTNKRTWIYSQRGANRSVRDERYKVNSNGSFYDLIADPFEKNDLRASEDKAVANARKRLGAVLSGFPADGPPPFEGYKPRRGGEE
jgi:arylsulfatase A-like enzyme